MLENTSILPTYTVSIEQNSEYIRRILPLMLKYNVPVDPMNYAVWYHYVAGLSTDLNMAIDAIIQEKKNFDSVTTLYLYKNYVCTASVESFEKINSNLLRLINKTAFLINDTGEKASATGDHLNFKLNELNAAENQANLKAILVEIILETTQLAEASKAQKNQLDNTTKEMELLRSELTHVRVAANTDGLTGLLNRLAFDKALGELVENATTKNACLAILDIDHFKRINDNFGHLVGDKVIKYFASLLKKHTAEHHYVARYGGEEMAIIMPDTLLTEAFHLIEQIRKALDKSQLKNKGGTENIGKVTVSAGIASLKATDTVYTFIERADNALYRAKETGRNKVVIESTFHQ